MKSYLKTPTAVFVASLVSIISFDATSASMNTGGNTLTAPDSGGESTVESKPVQQMLAINNIIVNTSEHVVTDGLCSLGEAIINANDDASTWPDCQAGSGEDTIHINGISTISPTEKYQDSDNAFPEITSSITIQGNNVTIARSSSYPFRLFSVAGPQARLQIGRATLQGGDIASQPGSVLETSRGGAIYVKNSGTLLLDRVSVFDSRADLGGGVMIEGGSIFRSFDANFSGNMARRGAGLYSDGSNADIRSTSFSDNYAQSPVSLSMGGAVFSIYSDVAMNGTIVEANSADIGGGMVNMLGKINMTQTSFLENAAATQHGAYVGIAMSEQKIRDSGFVKNRAFSGAGGLSVTGGEFSAVNVTISGNTTSDSEPAESDAGGISISQNSADVVLQNVTITNNTSHATGGLYLGAYQDVVMNDSLISGNTRLGSSPFVPHPAGDDLTNSIGSAYTHNGNVVGDFRKTTSQAIAGPFDTIWTLKNYTATSDGTTPARKKDIFDQTLSFANTPSPNMYPAPFHLIPPGSPALHTRSCSETGVLTDQRGALRTLSCDAGAIEM